MAVALPFAQAVDQANEIAARSPSADQVFLAFARVVTAGQLPMRERGLRDGDPARASREFMAVLAVMEEVAQ